jgi:alpha/beta superfamily hydrolase
MPRTEGGELMRREPVREIAGPAGRLEALLEEPVLAPGRPLRAAVVFAHPHPLHGGTMHTKAVFRGTKALASLGCAVLRFNFRGVGRSSGTFDNGVGELEDFRAGLDFMAGRYPQSDLWSAGFSFGAYIALTSGARDDRVSTLIGIAPALHMYDFSAVKESVKPKYFVQGARDELCPLAHMQAFFAELPPPKELAIVAGANHLFHGQVEEVGTALVKLLGTEERS